MRKPTKVAILILTGLTSVVAFAHSGATGIVKERMDYFKSSQANLKKIKAHIIEENYAAIIPLANGIASWADKMPDYFPAGSNIKPSEASPKIWLDFEGFTAAAQLNWKASSSLAKAAKMSDRNAVIRAFKKTADTCKSCHKTYRLK
jgi:cytochrome c556